MTGFGDAPLQQEEESTSLRAKRGEILARILFEKDKVIFREGQDGTDTFVVESGKIGVFKTVEGKPVRLAVLEKGAMFGEMAAITGERRTATTIALEPTVVCRISRTTMQQKIGGCDPFVRALLAILINNLSRVNERYATTAKAAEKMLADLKASTQSAKEPSPATAAPAKTDAKPA
jgi:CRP/FNR family transcriptional regulator, cyclic AMP receptor protein